MKQRSHAYFQNIKNALRGLHSREGAVVLAVGLLLAAASLTVSNLYAGALLGIVAFSCFWSIRELFEQEQRVKKGWFPKNEKRKKT